MSSSRPDAKSWRVSKPLEVKSRDDPNQLTSLAGLSQSARLPQTTTNLTTYSAPLSSSMAPSPTRRTGPKLGSRIKKTGTEKSESQEEAAIIIQSVVRTWIDMRRHRSLFLKYQKWSLILLSFSRIHSQLFQSLLISELLPLP
eukprot:TRINITY_DN5144_c0_g1_i1.p1 TRINITY_DN5144_c0_g1~~TRINITY_DN5144_c0_g1_i1.p1  ORF type:complete len:143 (+),score=16.52 TRINITY_DN5144_c0_g1_i1:399-827(+)